MQLCTCLLGLAQLSRGFGFDTISTLLLSPYSTTLSTQNYEVGINGSTQ